MKEKNTALSISTITFHHLTQECNAEERKNVRIEEDMISSFRR